MKFNTLAMTYTILSHKVLDQLATCTTLAHANIFVTNWKAFVSIFGACHPEVILDCCAWCVPNTVTLFAK